MVAVPFACPHCSGMFQVDSSMAGQHVACPHCRGVVALPPSAGSPSSPPQPPNAQQQPTRPATVPQPAARPQPAAQPPGRAVRVAAPRSPAGPLPIDPSGSPARPLAVPMSPRAPVTGPQRPPARPLARSQAAGSASGGQPAQDRRGTAPILAQPAGPLGLREPIKTAGRGDEVVELRTRSPQERAQRRLKKNLILWGLGLILIGITLAVLLTIGPL